MCIILAYLPLAFTSNVGLTYLLSFFCGDNIPKGLSARSLSRSLVKLYQGFIDSSRSEIKKMIPLYDPGHDPQGLARIFGIQQDGWSTKVSASGHSRRY